MLLDGLHLVSDALAAGLLLHHAAVASGAVNREEIQQVLTALTHAGVEVVEATSAVMAVLSPVRSPSPIVALAARPAANRANAIEGAPLVVIAVDVQDPGNLGAIVRVAEAGGASSLIVAGASADPFGWKALRGSMGSTLRLPVQVARDTVGAVAAARAGGCRIVATAPRGGRSPFDADLRGPTAVVIGGEGQGLDPEIVRGADALVTIPMHAPVESLNAAVTAALIVYEARRQRTLGKLELRSNK